MIKALNLAFFGFSSNFIYFKGYFFVMAEKKSDLPVEGGGTQTEVGETPRDFGLEERIEVLKEDPDTDIFDEVISGKKRAARKIEVPVVEEKIAEIKPVKDLPAKQKNAKKSASKKSKKQGPQPVVEKSFEPESVGVKPADEPADELADEPESIDDSVEEKTGPDSEEIIEGDEAGDEKEIDLEHETGSREEGATIGDESRRREIKEMILKKASLLSVKDIGGSDSLPLKFLEDEKTKSVFIGRKKSVYKEYGFESSLLLGRVNESEHKEKFVYLDGLNPHVVFICGARGSGKSYALGIIAEELALKNKNVGTIMIDPIGVFWSMRFPNTEEREVQKLKEWGLKPRGLDNLKVFIPIGLTSSVPKSTYDKGFAIQPSLLTGEDWTLTFMIDRFSITGLLLEQALKKVEKGYVETESGKKIGGKGKNYSLDDIINCLHNDKEINSREIGYKQDSIRALTSRFAAAKTWGIFSEKGTPLGELSREGQLTILDTSFLEDNVTALVIGVLARRILSARKLSTRKEAANKFKSMEVDELFELEIPPTWLIVDEAHTLIPSGNEKTPASNPLIEYAKQGRRPGCSLVFATQQPSAIDTKVLSQLDIILTHKLVFDDDVKAVNKRTPTIIPAKYRKSSFIKTLPVGVALTGDRREETTRAFVMEIRPRFSQHEGRDVEATKVKSDMKPVQARQLALDMIAKDVLKEKTLEFEKIESIIGLMNSKYKAGLDIDSVLKELENRGLFVGQKTVSTEPIKKEAEETQEESSEDADEADEAAQGETEAGGQEGDDGTALQNESEKKSDLQTELLALPLRVDKAKAQGILNSVRGKKLFGLLGEDEKIESFGLKYLTVWKVRYDVISRSGKEFLTRHCFINAHTGEFIHFLNDQFVESSGLKEFFDMDDEDLAVLLLLNKGGHTADELVAKTGFGDGKIHRILSKLNEKSLIGAIVNNRSGKRTFGLKEKLDIPLSERHDLLESISKLPFVRAEMVNKGHEVFLKKHVPLVLQKLWKNVVVKDVSEIYKPVWEAALSMQNKQRLVQIDAVTGKVLSK